jgi:hypothetical protein
VSPTVVHIAGALVVRRLTHRDRWPGSRINPAREQRCRRCGARLDAWQPTPWPAGSFIGVSENRWGESTAKILDHDARDPGEQACVSAAEAA